MNKMIKYIKKNAKVIVIFIICMIITGGISAYAASIITAGDVYYTSNGQETVQGAIDDLYTKANQTVTVDGIENIGFSTNTAKTVFANSSGLCITRKKKTSCFKINNYETEKTHIQQVFSDIRCYVGSDVDCRASDFRCVVKSRYVDCADRSDNSYCRVYSDGDVSCH